MYSIIEPWPRVCAHPRHFRISFDQCQLGQRNSKGQPVRKPTELRASDPDLLHYFQHLTCGRFPRLCNGHHEPLTGHEAYRARIWPWAFARRLAWGIIRLMRKKHWRPQHSGHYPTLPDAQVTCTACKRRWRSDHIEHTRVRGGCRYPDVEGVEYGCPA